MSTRSLRIRALIFMFVLLEPKSTLHILGTQDKSVKLNLNLGYPFTQHTFAKFFPPPSKTTCETPIFTSLY